MERNRDAPPYGVRCTMKSIPRASVPVLAIPLVLMGSCSREESASEQFVRAATARANTFQETLKGELMAALQKGGPKSAIEVCSQRAPAIATAASTDGLRVRRIGTRLRNAANAANERDRAILAELGARTEGHDAPHLFVGTGTEQSEPQFALYVPIRIAAACLTCHGDKAQLPPEVTAALQERYPADEATGYALSDLRGAVVIEQTAK